MRATLDGSVARLAPTAFASPIVRAIHVGREASSARFVFLTSDGLVTRAERFDGAAEPLGEVPGPWREVQSEGAALTIIDARGRLWVTDGESSVVPIQPPAAHLAFVSAAFVSASSGVAVVDGGGAFRFDRARGWHPMLPSRAAYLSVLRRRNGSLADVTMLARGQWLSASDEGSVARSEPVPAVTATDDDTSDSNSWSASEAQTPFRDAVLGPEQERALFVELWTRAPESALISPAAVGPTARGTVFVSVRQWLYEVDITAGAGVQPRLAAELPADAAFVSARWGAAAWDPRAGDGPDRTQRALLVTMDGAAPRTREAPAGSLVDGVVDDAGRLVVERCDGAQPDAADEPNRPALCVRSLTDARARPRTVPLRAQGGLSSVRRIFAVSRDTAAVSIGRRVEPGSIDRHVGRLALVDLNTGVVTFAGGEPGVSSSDSPHDRALAARFVDPEHVTLAPVDGADPRRPQVRAVLVARDGSVRALATPTGTECSAYLDARRAVAVHRASVSETTAENPAGSALALSVSEDGGGHWRRLALSDALARRLRGGCSAECSPRACTLGDLVVTVSTDGEDGEPLTFRSASVAPAAPEPERSSQTPYGLECSEGAAPRDVVLAPDARWSRVTALNGTAGVRAWLEGSSTTRADAGARAASATQRVRWLYGNDGASRARTSLGLDGWYRPGFGAAPSVLHVAADALVLRAPGAFGERDNVLVAVDREPSTIVSTSQEAAAEVDVVEAAPGRWLARFYGALGVQRDATATALSFAEPSARPFDFDRLYLLGRDGAILSRIEYAWQRWGGRERARGFARTVGEPNGDNVFYAVESEPGGPVWLLDPSLPSTQDRSRVVRALPTELRPCAGPPPARYTLLAGRWNNGGFFREGTMNDRAMWQLAEVSDAGVCLRAANETAFPLDPRRWEGIAPLVAVDGALQRSPATPGFVRCVPRR